MTRTGDSEEKVSKAKGNADPVDGRPSSWLVKVKNNPGFCGIGAGGIQFANGKAMTASARIAEWFREHEGYEVVEQQQIGGVADGS